MEPTANHTAFMHLGGSALGTFGRPLNLVVDFVQQELGVDRHERHCLLEFIVTP